MGTARVGGKSLKRKCLLVMETKIKSKDELKIRKRKCWWVESEAWWCFLWNFVSVYSGLNAEAGEVAVNFFRTCIPALKSALKVHNKCTCYNLLNVVTSFCFWQFPSKHTVIITTHRWALQCFDFIYPSQSELALPLSQHLSFLYSNPLEYLQPLITAITTHSELPHQPALPSSFNHCRPRTGDLMYFLRCFQNGLCKVKYFLSQKTKKKKQSDENKLSDCPTCKCGRNFLGDE